MIPPNQIQVVVVGELQKRSGLLARNQISLSEYLRALSFGFYALYYPAGQRSLALNLKYTFNQYKRSGEVYPWIMYFFGWDKDYDLASYDTGDPLELAMKIMTGWAMSWRYLLGQNPPRGVKVWKKEDFESIFHISERIILDSIEDEAPGIEDTAAVWVSMIDWTGYKFDTSEVYEWVLERAKQRQNPLLRATILGERDMLKRVQEDYYSWIPHPKVVSGKKRW